MSKVGGGRRLGTCVSSLDGKLASYLAATAGIGAILAKDAQAAVVANTTVQPFGINGVVNIDFNSDSQIDFQIDHDRYNLNGTNLDYLQVDKNDINGETNPLAMDPYSWTTFPTTTFHYTPFPLNQSSHRNDDAMVLSFTNDFGDQGGYVVGLEYGDEIGGTGSEGDSLIPGAIWDWQEGASFTGTNKYIRANRLLDEDHGQIDANAGRMVTYPSLGPFGPQPEFPGLDDFSGLPPEDNLRYVGVRVDLNDAGYANAISNANAATGDDPANYWYGWIGIRITNEADATGEVVGYAYESVKGMSILAGDVGTPVLGEPGDYNGDDVVDAADYAVWRNHLGDANEANLSNNGDGGNVSATDYTWWKQHYGNPMGGGGGVAVPEPGSMALAAIGGFGLLVGFVAKRFLGGKNR